MPKYSIVIKKENSWKIIGYIYLIRDNNNNNGHLIGGFLNISSFYLIMITGTSIDIQRNVLFVDVFLYFLGDLHELLGTKSTCVE